jgi:hypothetical protein
MPAATRALPWLAVLTLAATACSQPETKTNYTVKLCIPTKNWGRLEKTMRDFGERSGLEFHGEIASLSRMKPAKKLHDSLNYALISGLHQFGGDDIDLWLTSNPFAADEVYLNVLSKHDLTPKQRSTAVDFRRTLNALACSAR